MVVKFYEYRVRTPQLKSWHATTKTQHSQRNKTDIFKDSMNILKPTEFYILHVWIL